MKNNMTTIKQLQDEINGKLEAYAGKRYEGTEFHSWYQNAIYAALDDHGIKELRPGVWCIATDASESGVSFFGDHVAEVEIDRRIDKRFKYKDGRGVVNSITVKFRPEIMDMTCDAARRFLFGEKREEYIKRVEQIRDKAMEEAQKAAAELARLKELQF